MAGPDDIRFDVRDGRLVVSFRDIDKNPAPVLEPPVAMADGPLTQGVAVNHDDMPTRALEFAVAMRQGMADTGTILERIIADFDNIDQNNAKSIDKLFAPPDGNAPEGGQ